MPLRPVLPAVIGQLARGGAAEQAGLQPGDRIVRADGQIVTDWQHWRDIIERHPELPFSIRIERDGLEQTVDLVPDARENERGAARRLHRRDCRRAG
jgi:regulator of sigma E protease